MSSLIENSEPVRREPFPKWPFYAADEVEAAMKVLQSGKVNYWTGEEGRLFEKEFAASIGLKYVATMMMEMVHCKV